MICLITEERFEAELYRKRSESQHESTQQDTAAMMAKRVLLPYTRHAQLNYPTSINNKESMLHTTGAALDQAIRKVFTEDRLYNRKRDEDKNFQKEGQQNEENRQKILENIPYGKANDEEGYLVYEQAEDSKSYICSIVQCKIDEFKEDKNYDKRRAQEQEIKRKREQLRQWDRIENRIAHGVNLGFEYMITGHGVSGILSISGKALRYSTQVANISSKMVTYTGRGRIIIRGNSQALTAIYRNPNPALNTILNAGRNHQYSSNITQTTLQIADVPPLPTTSVSYIFRNRVTFENVTARHMRVDYIKTGTTTMAKTDFLKMNLKPVSAKASSKGDILVGETSEGYKVIFRTFSEDGRTTIEFQRVATNGKTRSFWKIRYGEKLDTTP